MRGLEGEHRVVAPPRLTEQGVIRQHMAGDSMVIPSSPQTDSSLLSLLVAVTPESAWLPGTSSGSGG